MEGILYFVRNQMEIGRTDESTAGFYFFLLKRCETNAGVKVS